MFHHHANRITRQLLEHLFIWIDLLKKTSGLDLIFLSPFSAFVLNLTLQFSQFSMTP